MYAVTLYKESGGDMSEVSSRSFANNSEAQRYIEQLRTNVAKAYTDQGMHSVSFPRYRDTEHTGTIGANYFYNEIHADAEDYAVYEIGTPISRDIIVLTKIGRTYAVPWQSLLYMNDNF